MTALTEIALVRHGRYDYHTGHLTNDGIRQADEAAAELVRGFRFLGAVILTSPAPRAEETADRIGMKVGEGEGTVIVRHQALQLAGEHPRVMPNLRSMTRAVLETEVPDLQHTGHVVIVTHLPLIAALMGFDDVAGVPNGSVHYYEGDGSNPEYEPGFESALEGILDLPKE